MLLFGIHQSKPCHLLSLLRVDSSSSCLLVSKGHWGGGLFGGWTIPLECSPTKEGGGSDFLLTHLVSVGVSAAG